MGTQDQRIEERILVAPDAAALAHAIEDAGQFLLEARRIFPWSELVTAAPPADEIALALRQIALLSRSGASWVEAFRAVADSSASPRLTAALADVSARLSAGSSLPAALEMHADVFDALLVAATRAAADPVRVQLAFQRRAEGMLEREELVRKLRNALSYPVLLLGISGIVLSFLIGYVVPSIGRLFEESGTALPPLTRVTLLVAGWVRSTAGFWIPGSAVVVAAFCAWARTLRGGRALDAFLGRIPLVGIAWTSPPWTLWALAVSDALTAGLALPHALRMAAGVVVRPHLASDLAGVADAVERGSTLSSALEKADARCPRLLSGALSIGARGTDLASVLEGAARSEAARVTWALARITRSVEPLLLVGVGAVIGTTVIALYLPILSLVETF